MNTVTLSPTSSLGAKYWSEPSDEKGWTKSFAGRWQDDRTTEEIIEDIRTSRNANIKEVEL